MAFTDTERTDIRFFLGYPDVYQYTNPRLESAMDLVGERPAPKAKVLVILARLNLIYGAAAGDPGQIDTAIQKAGLKAVESADDRIEFGESGGGSGNSSSAALNTTNDVGRQLAGALSSFLGVAIATNVFGKAGYQGDSWMANNGNSMGPRAFLIGG